MALKHTIASAYDTLRESASAMLEAQNEWAIWRHQLIGERNPLADNAMGMDPGGKYWKTKDYLVKVQHQGVDHTGRSVIYTQVEPVVGDLIITLAGTPQSSEAALVAARAGYYKIDEIDVRRDAQGRIIYTKLHVIADRTGQWNDYQYKGGDTV